MKVVRYDTTQASAWNHFLETAKNSTFLFNRNFCDYHADRFLDHSVLVFKNGTLLSVFPANEHAGEVISHGGLTYGGLVVDKNISLPEVIQVLKALLFYYFEQDIFTIIYKETPAFYHTTPAFEDQYALFLADADLIRRDTSFVTDLRAKIPFQERRMRSISKALKSGVQVLATDGFEVFWNEVLSPNLQSRFGVKPIHSLAEINQLAANFPQNIKQYIAVSEGRVVAGTTVFENNRVAHAQYISASEAGRSSGAIDLLFEVLLKQVYKDFDYFSFGISNENQGRTLNHGLAEWKEGFGAKVWLNNFYRVSTQNYTKL